MTGLIQSLRGDLPVLAVNAGGPGLAIPDALHGSAGTALFVDCERTAISVSDAAWMARAARANGLFCLLRCENADAATVTRYLDCRIDALVVPQVESAAACAALAHAFQVHGSGIHGAGATRTACIAQIESVAGHAALDAIATAPGIDAVLIGPNDLAASMGLAGKPGHPDVAAAVEDIATRLRAADMPFGLPVTAATARGWAEKGARLFYLALAPLLGAGLGQFREAPR